MQLKTLAVSLLIGLPLLAGPTVQYDLSFPNAVHHEADIQATFSGLSQGPLEIFMSRSSPGRYALHEFAKNVSQFRATDASGQALPVEHDSPYSWRVSPQQGTVICHYTLYADRIDGTYSAVDVTHAHLNLPATLVWAQGLESAPINLRFHVPAGSGWKAATQLVPNPDGSFSAPHFAGSNLEWMMDSPVELSAMTTRDWMVNQTTFRLALHHQGSDAEATAFAEMCKTVVAEERGIFGAFPRYDNGLYTFLVDYLPWADGDGMEHRNSTVISGPMELSDSAHRAIGTISHEFFHCWNVKRIRPKSLEPFDFERADMSGELWFAEGFTNYYGLLVLHRAAIYSFDEFVGAMGGALNSVINDPGQKILSPVGMSEQAPFVDAARSIDATNNANNFISYYTYGQALALGIDLAMRARYPGKSLDDWMRTMWQRHPDANLPYTLDDLERALAETTADAPFAHQLFQDHILGLKPLAYQQLLAPAGLRLTLAHPQQMWLGRTLTNANEKGVELTRPTLRDSPLYLAGVDSGDTIQACDQQAVKSLAQLDSCSLGHKPGDLVSLRVKGRSGIRTVSVNLVQDPTLQLVSFEKLGEPVTAQILDFRKQWLSSKATPDRPVRKFR